MNDGYDLLKPGFGCAGGLFDFARIVLNKGRPSAVTFAAAQGAAGLKMVAKRYCEGVGSVEIFFLELAVQDVFQHAGYLFLGGVAVAGDGAFLYRALPV